MASTGVEFPMFDDGDLIVVFGGGRTLYRLHANVFRRASGVFSQILAEETGAVLSARAKKEGISIRFRLELVNAGSGKAHFVRKSVDSMGRSRASNMLPAIENGKAPSEVYRHYDNFFRTFYNEQLNLDSTNLATVLHDCVGLIDVAEEYQATGAVRESVDIALLRQGQVLFKAISSNPIAWANLSLRVQSPSIMRDSMIHLVGMWAKLTAVESAELKPLVLRACERKYKELELIKEGTEIRILGHYSEVVQKRDLDNPGRMQYSNDVYSWMALSLFRQWFGQNVALKNNREAEDGGFGFYYMLSKGDQAYLTREQCLTFHLYCPMSQKGKTVFENHLTAFKGEIQRIVAPLMVNRTQLEPKEHACLRHLTCLEVLEEDFPWKLAAEESDVAREGGG